MIPTVQAAVFHKFMGTGRTTPALCACEDADGNTVGDFVVKLRGGTERGATGMVSELVGSLLAAYFGIPVPPPSLVHIEAAFADLVGQRHPDKSQRMSGSVGLNFGSRQLNDVVTWPIDKSVPDAMWATATSIFAFDALIENPDASSAQIPTFSVKATKSSYSITNLRFRSLRSCFRRQPHGNWNGAIIWPITCTSSV